MNVVTMAFNYLSEKSWRTREISPQTLCVFTSETNEDDPQLSSTGTGRPMGIDEDEIEDPIESSCSGTVINIRPWVNRVRFFGGTLFTFYLT